MRIRPTFFTFVLLLGIMTIPSMGCLEIAPEYIKPYQPELGITFHGINNDYEYAEKYINNASLGTIRYDIEWKRTFPEKDTPDNEYINQMINITRFYGLRGYRQVIVLWHPPDWVEDYSPSKFTEEYLKFVEVYITNPLFMADIIQIGNEPNNPLHSKVFNIWSNSDIHDFIEEASLYVKSERPEVMTAINFQVIVNWQYRMHNIVVSNGDMLDIDILAIDYYPGTWNVGSYRWPAMRIYMDYLDQYERYKGAVFETGYSTPTTEIDSEYHQHIFYTKDIPYLIDMITQYNYQLTSATTIDYLLFYSLENLDTNLINPEANFGLIVFNRSAYPVKYKQAYFDVQKLDGYVAKAIGAGVRLPLYGFSVSLTLGLVYFGIIFLTSFIIGYALYVTIISNSEFDIDIDRQTRIQRAIFAMKYATIITSSIFILAVIPLTFIYGILIIPLLYYITTKNPGYLFASTASITIVYILYIVMLQIGIFVV